MSARWSEWKAHDGSGYPLGSRVEAEAMAMHPFVVGAEFGPLQAPAPDAKNWRITAPVFTPEGIWLPITRYRVRRYPAADRLIEQAKTLAPPAMVTTP